MIAQSVDNINQALPSKYQHLFLDQLRKDTESNSFKFTMKKRHFPDPQSDHLHFPNLQKDGLSPG
jgi:hypothetical protein